MARIGTLRQASVEHGLAYSTLRYYASTRPGFPVTLDTDGRAPLRYDLDDIATWIANRPGQGARTDLKTH